MKDVILGGGACIMVGFGVYFSPPFNFGTTEIIDISKGPVVAGTNDQIADMLLQSTVDSDARFKLSVLDKKRASDDTVEFSRLGSSTKMVCNANIQRIDDVRAQVVTDCDAFKQGWNTAASATDGSAIASVGNDVVNTAFREFVDATIEKRAYNDDKIMARAFGQIAKNQGAIREEFTKAP